MTEIIEKERESYICNCLDASFAFFIVSVDTRMGPLMKPMQRCDLGSIAAVLRADFLPFFVPGILHQFSPAHRKKNFQSQCLNFIINFINNKLNY